MRLKLVRRTDSEGGRFHNKGKSRVEVVMRRRGRCGEKTFAMHANLMEHALGVLLLLACMIND